jgi:protein-disulfide isomerase
MGTPAIFINGTLLSGALAESVFERVIESELAALEKKRATN